VSCGLLASWCCGCLVFLTCNTARPPVNARVVALYFSTDTHSSLGLGAEMPLDMSSCVPVQVLYKELINDGKQDALVEVCQEHTM
jgi:hypothetical protein